MEKQIRCVEIHGADPDDSLSEINDRLKEFGVTQENTISVQVRPAVNSTPIRKGYALRMRQPSGGAAPERERGEAEMGQPSFLGSSF